MLFYHAPASSSQAVHIMLREAGLDFSPCKVDVVAHTLEDGSDFYRINPNGYVPALVFDDGTLFTENAAIIDWIASRSPAFLPEGELGRTRHLQMLAFISTEIQKPFIPLFFLEDEEERDRLGKRMEQRLRWLGSKVEGDFLFGPRFTGADAFAYVMTRWAAMVGMPYPDALRGLAANVEQRPAVKATLAAEGVEALG